MSSKICTQCGIEKSLEEFHKRKETKDGRRSACKACKSAYNKSLPPHRRYIKPNPHPSGNWKPVTGFETLYEVSDKGELYALPRQGSGGHGGKLCATKVDKDGYLIAQLRRDNKTTYKRLHRIVAQVFIPNPYNHPVINHIDYDRTNNSIDNLEWCTVKENNQHTWNGGRGWSPFMNK
jgi:hypothetical protein